MNYSDEHDFYRYWINKLESGTVLTSGDFDEIASYPEWHYAANTIITYACRDASLSLDKARQLYESNDVDVYAKSQLLSYLSLNDDSLEWTEKLQIALENRANWAIWSLIHKADHQLLQDAIERIKISNRPKSVKNRFLQEIHSLLSMRTDELSK